MRDQSDKASHNKDAIWEEEGSWKNVLCCLKQTNVLCGSREGGEFRYPMEPLGAVLGPVQRCSMQKELQIKKQGSSVSGDGAGSPRGEKCQPLEVLSCTQFTDPVQSFRLLE